MKGLLNHRRNMERERIEERFKLRNLTEHSKQPTSKKRTIQRKQQIQAKVYILGKY